MLQLIVYSFKLGLAAGHVVVCCAAQHNCSTGCIYSRRTGDFLCQNIFRNSDIQDLLLRNATIAITFASQGVVAPLAWIRVGGR